jgi:tetratricopeptide (TPR) repeat protein
MEAGMNRDELLAQYEATGDDEVFRAARKLYEAALAASPDDADLHMNYGYLLECHARNQLRQAAAYYERAIALNPNGTKAHFHLIGARAGLLEPETAIELYERCLAAAPHDLDAHRLLAAAYLAGHQYEQARRVIEAGLALAPNDAQLIENRGDVRAGTGDPDGALADWRRSRELDPEKLSSVYSSAFLLEREGRLEEALDAWRSIINWSEVRGYVLDTLWPKQELERLRSLAASASGQAPAG